MIPQARAEPPSIREGDSDVRWWSAGTTDWGCEARSLPSRGCRQTLKDTERKRGLQIGTPVKQFLLFVFIVGTYAYVALAGVPPRIPAMPTDADWVVDQPAGARHVARRQI